MEKTIQEIINKSHNIVIVQADNPDADSLASALLLEQILSDLGKNAFLYCGVAMPTYLRYITGWDRVQDILPPKFDASMIVDTSAIILLERLQKTQSIGWLKAKPCVVIDHHTDSQSTIDFAEVNYIKKAVATGEVIYELAAMQKWNLNQVAKDMVMTSIMSDSLGLTSEGTSARSIEIVAELVKTGVSIPKLENARRKLQKKSPELLRYKADLLKRVDYSDDGRIAYLSIPWEEIEKYSHEYNPSVLVLDEMRMVEKVALAIAFKTYPDGKITAKLRANYGFPVAAKLAESYGGGGHPYAAGFKVTDAKPYNELKSDCIKKAQSLLDALKKDSQDETSQYAYSVG